VPLPLLALPLPLLAVLRLHLAPLLADALPVASVLPLPVARLPLPLAVPLLLAVPPPWLLNALPPLAVLKQPLISKKIRNKKTFI
jgi:hypothetical protein